MLAMGVEGGALGMGLLGDWGGVRDCGVGELASSSQDSARGMGELGRGLPVGVLRGGEEIESLWREVVRAGG